jgi:hypothetical protein
MDTHALDHLPPLDSQQDLHGDFCCAHDWRWRLGLLLLAAF